MIDCEWLPSLIPYDGGEWEVYEAILYQIFKKDFIVNSPYYKNNKVVIRKHPMFQSKEEAFFHITCKEDKTTNDRVPDLRRCERIKWVKAFIDNAECDIGCSECEGIKVWDKPYNNTVRTHILFEEQKYMVVLEKRIDYVLLITAFYLDYEHQLRKKVQEYKKYFNKAKDASY